MTKSDQKKNEEPLSSDKDKKLGKAKQENW